MKYIVTKSFQFRGTAHRGQVLDLTEAEAAVPFVARHVEPLLAERSSAITTARGDAATERRAAISTGAEAQYFGNGKVKVVSRETPAAVAAEDADGLTVGQLRAKLSKLGVHYTNKMSAAELTALYRQAQEAVAGSPATPNRPTA